MTLIGCDWRADTKKGTRLPTEPIQGAPLALECIHNVHRRDGLAASVLCVRDRVSDHVFEEDFEHASRLLVDEAGHALNASLSSEAADCGLGDALDVVAENLSVAARQPSPSQGYTSHPSSSASVANWDGECGRSRQGEERETWRDARHLETCMSLPEKGVERVSLEERVPDRTRERESKKQKSSV